MSHMMVEETDADAVLPAAPCMLFSENVGWRGELRDKRGVCSLVHNGQAAVLAASSLASGHADGSSAISGVLAQAQLGAVADARACAASCLQRQTCKPSVARRHCKSN